MSRRVSIAAQAPVVKEVVTVEDGAVASMGRRMIEFQWDRRGSHVDFQGLVDEAKDATEAEHSMTVWEAIKLYPKAVGWSVLASTALVMEGYDLVVIYSFYAFPAFQRKYGEPADTHSGYSISSAWQSGLSNGANVGEIIGLMLTGIVVEKYGYKKTIAGALVAVTCFIFLTFFAVNIEMLLVGEILCGLPWGVFQTVTTAYAAEVTPTPLRHVLTTYVNLCWVLGQFIGSGVLRALVNNSTEWAYRIPFALQWMWPIPLLIGILLAPESPWWLCKMGNYAAAEHSLRRLTSHNPNVPFEPQKTISMMVHTIELEKEITSGTSYWDCLKSVDLRRTEIACMVWIIQVACGGGLMGTSTQFYEQAGLNPSNSFSLALGQYAIGAVGTIASWFTMIKFGRRFLYIWGLVGMCVILLVVGFLGIPGPDNSGASWASGSMILIYTFIYDFTIGPVCYCIVAEVSSVRLRNKTIVLARNAYNVAGIINNILTPHMLNPLGWNWRNYTGFFWAGICALTIVWCFFRLPETKGKTYGELDILFERRVPARRFATTAADPFRGDTLEARHGSIVKVVSQDSAYNRERSTDAMDEKIRADGVVSHQY